MSSEPAADSRRLFFALWPRDDLRALIETQTRTIARQSGGRLIPARNFHVTVLFLGEVLLSRVEAAQQAAALTKAACFDMAFDQIESWPGSNVLCLTSARTPPALGELAEQLRFSLLAQQFKLRKQVFRPHVTLVRDLPRMRLPEPIEGFHWHVDELVLVESRLIKGGSKYSLLGRWPLQNGGQNGG